MKIVKVRNVKTPTRGTGLSAGLDFYIPDDFEAKQIWPGESINIPSGIKARIPRGCALIMFNKSGIATKYQLQVGACVVDEDYQGEIHLHVDERRQGSRHPQAGHETGSGFGDAGLIRRGGSSRVGGRAFPAIDRKRTGGLRVHG